MLLSKKKCVPCEGGIPALSKEKVKELLKEVPGWTVKDGKLFREFKFKDFKQALKFINKMAGVAEEQGHHPDFTLHSWNKVSVVLYTHAINGLHENDFIMALKIAKLIKHT